MIGFREWLTQCELLTEIGHIRLPHEQTLTLPDARGLPQQIPVLYCDPLFERWKPVGHHRDENDELQEFGWQQMINTNPVVSKSGQPPGIGWEGLLPFTHNIFFGVAPREIYATIGRKRNLIRVPDDWYMHARFVDSEGEISYEADQGIFGPEKQFTKRKELFA